MRTVTPRKDSCVLNRLRRGMDRSMAVRSRFTLVQYWVDCAGVIFRPEKVA